jgi:3'(2'), 5'-bisphosphate nucleotidase
MHNDSISNSVLHRLRLACCDVAAEAGRRIMEIAAEGVDTEIKADGSPLTRADLASNTVILEALSKFEPRFPVVSEECDHAEVAAACPDVYWLVDPLDGTKEFVKGIPEYTVNIALIEDGVPVLGVVYIPASGLGYSACRGDGAWRTEPGGEARRIHAAGTENPVVAVVSRSHPSEATNAFLERVGVRETMPRGSSLKICAVADGSADLYPRLGPTWFWDSAAGVAVALESGARATTPEGGPLDYSLGGTIKHPGFVVWSPATCSPF